MIHAKIFHMKCALIAIACVLITSTAFAGKFKPVQGEDWPESGESSSTASSSDDTQGDDSGTVPRAPSGMPKIRTLPDGTPDPDSLKDYLQN